MSWSAFWGQSESYEDDRDLFALQAPEAASGWKRDREPHREIANAVAELQRTGQRFGTPDASAWLRSSRFAVLVRVTERDFGGRGMRLVGLGRLDRDSDDSVSWAARQVQEFQLILEVLERSVDAACMEELERVLQEMGESASSGLAFLEDMESESGGCRRSAGSLMILLLLLLTVLISQSCSC